MNNPSEKLRNMRLDLSPYLFHFTDSIDTLWVILGELCLKSPKHNYVCFYRNPIMYDGANVGLHGENQKANVGKVWYRF